MSNLRQDLFERFFDFVVSAFPPSGNGNLPAVLRGETELRMARFVAAPAAALTDQAGRFFVREMARGGLIGKLALLGFVLDFG